MASPAACLGSAAAGPRGDAEGRARIHRGGEVFLEPPPQRTPPAPPRLLPSPLHLIPPRLTPLYSSSSLSAASSPHPSPTPPRPPSVSFPSSLFCSLSLKGRSFSSIPLSRLLLSPRSTTFSSAPLPSYLYSISSHLFPHPFRYAAHAGTCQGDGVARTHKTRTHARTHKPNITSAGRV